MNDGLKTLPKETLSFEVVGGSKKTAAVIVAAGGSDRMNGVNKQFAELLGIPVLARTMLSLENCPEISDIVVVAREEDIPEVQKLAIAYQLGKLRGIAAGGSTRMRSVEKGVEACPKDAAYYAIHDGARPNASRELIAAVVRKAWETGAAAPAVPLKDTAKFAENGVIKSTPERAALIMVQTPQVFESELFLRALTKTQLLGGDACDDCLLVERLGETVCLTEGDYANIKITTPEDLAVAEALILFKNR